MQGTMQGTQPCCGEKPKGGDQSDPAETNSLHCRAAVQRRGHSLRRRVTIRRAETSLQGTHVRMTTVLLQPIRDSQSSESQTLL